MYSWFTKREYAKLIQVVFFFKMPDFLDRGSTADLIYLGPSEAFDAATHRKCFSSQGRQKLAQKL